MIYPCYFYFFQRNTPIFRSYYSVYDELIFLYCYSRESNLLITSIHENT